MKSVVLALLLIKYFKNYSAVMYKSQPLFSQWFHTESLFQIDNSFQAERRLLSS